MVYKRKRGWTSGRSLTGVTLSEAEYLVHSVSNIYDVPDPNLSSEGQILSIQKKLDCFSLFYLIFGIYFMVESHKCTGNIHSV